MDEDPADRAETDFGLLQEMLRESERILDHQVSAIEELDDKSEHMLTLSVAVLGGGAALATVGVQSSSAHADAWFLMILGLAGSFNLTSLAFFLGSCIGFRAQTEMHVGPSVEWIAAKASDDTWNPVDHYASVLADIPRYYEWNNAREAFSATRRSRGTYALVAAAAIYGFAFLYIVARSIGGT